MGFAPELHDILKEEFGDAIVEDVREGDKKHVVDPFVVVKAERLLDVARFLKNDSRLKMDLLSLVSGVDYPDREVIEVVYYFDSTKHGHSLGVKVALPRDNPRVASLVSIWKTADWQERETFDLIGVTFEGHPNLVRILCAEDWEGHALRKDYVIPETYRGIRNVVY